MSHPTKAPTTLPAEARSDPQAAHKPVSGSCARCGCPLGYAAVEREAAWFCCGGCAGSGRCNCGCEHERRSALGTDAYIPTRRMFASRRPDELASTSQTQHYNRAFPFADIRRGR